MAESSRHVTLDIPPGIGNGSRYEIVLERIGISNLILDMMVLWSRAECALKCKLNQRQLPR